MITVKRVFFSAALFTFCLLLTVAGGYAEVSQPDYQPVLDFWFGTLVDGYPQEERRQLWFMGKPEDDRTIEKKFGMLTMQAVEGQLSSWEESPKGRLALIILLDQFTRSIYRSTAAAFSGDYRAQLLARDAINKGWDTQLALAERQFIYMPLMHSESLSDQELCISTFKQLARDAPAARQEYVKGSIHYAEEHRDLIVRFGRFPHRNKALGRQSTEKELEHLAAGASTYGQ